MSKNQRNPISTSDLADQYDLIVLGDHPSALLSGCLAAKQGGKVLFLRDRPLPAADDSELNLLIPVPAITSNDIGATEQMKPFDPAILSPDLRLVLHRDDEELLGEIRRGFGPEIAEALRGSSALLDSYAELSRILDRLSLFEGNGPDSRETGKLLDALVKMAKGGARSASLSPSLRDRLGLLAESLQWALSPHQAFHSRKNARTSRASSGFLFFISLMRRSFSFKGGLSAYRRYLLSRAVQFGATVSEESEIEEIVLGPRKRAEGIRVRGKTGIIRSRAIALGKLLDEIRPITSARLTRSPECLGWIFTVNCRIGAQAQGVRVSDHWIWQEKDAPPISFEFEDGSTRGGSEDRAEETVRLRTALPYLKQSLDPDFQRRTVSRLLRKASEVLPFFENHLIEVAPKSNSKAGLYTSLDQIPSPTRLFGGMGTGIRSGVTGLLVCTDEAFPHLGIASPIVIASQVLAQLRAGQQP